MVNKDKMKAFEVLDKLYPKDIGFLFADTPFQFLVSVCLSAQTTDAAVMKITPILFSKYPDEKALSKAELSSVEEIIHPLGFYRVKAKNIISLAKAIVELGYIPDTIEELIKLPGVGRKTANCYILHICSKSAIIVDTHFKRVAKRLGFTDEVDPDKVELDIKKHYYEAIWSRLSMVLNLHGRKFCYSKNPNCEACPVNAYCRSVKPSK